MALNLLLQDPFSVLKEYPETLTNVLESPFYSVCLKFSPCGDYLATGCGNGAIIIYDMDTYKPIKMLGNNNLGCNLTGHVSPIQSIEWSNCGRYLLTSSRDCTIKLWDLACNSGTKCNCCEYRFDSFPWKTSFIPNCVDKCFVCVFEEHLPFILDFGVNNNNNKPEIYPIIDTEDFLNKENEQLLLIDDIELKKYGFTLSLCTCELQQQGSASSNILITGTSKGYITVFQQITNDSSQKLHYKITKIDKLANSTIKNIIVSQSMSKMCINSSDRTIRQYEILISSDSATPVFEIIELQHKYQDVINKLQWNHIALGPNTGEYLVASPHGSTARDLYLWETTTGSLVRVLEGAADEELLCIDWNYYNMCIASNSLESGNIYIWSIIVPPKWSALAPDFEEIDENVVYIEKEDEFDDIVDVDEEKRQQWNKEQDIDLITRERYDVRGNDLGVEKFVIPVDYTDIIMMLHPSNRGD